MEKTIFKEEKDRIELIKQVDITDILEFIALERKYIGKGFTKEKNMRKIATIPIDVLMSLPKEKAVAILTDPREMKKFIKANPQFKACEGNI